MSFNDFNGVYWGFVLGGKGGGEVGGSERVLWDDYATRTTKANHLLRKLVGGNGNGVPYQDPVKHREMREIGDQSSPSINKTAHPAPQTLSYGRELNPKPSSLNPKPYNPKPCPTEGWPGDAAPVKTGAESSARPRGMFNRLSGTTHVPCKVSTWAFFRPKYLGLRVLGLTWRFMVLISQTCL